MNDMKECFSISNCKSCKRSFQFVSNLIEVRMFVIEPTFNCFLCNTLLITTIPLILCQSTGVAKNNSQIKLKETHKIRDKSPRHPCPILCEICNMIQADKVRPIWNMIFVLKKLIRRPRPMIEDKVWTNHFGVPDAEIKIRIVIASN